MAARKKNRSVPIVTNPDRTLEEIKEIVRSNQIAQRNTYNGLESSEVGKYNRSLMFGDNDEAFPDQETWSRIVD